MQNNNALKPVPYVYPMFDAFPKYPDSRNQVINYYYNCDQTSFDPSWSIKVSTAAQKFTTSITDCKGSDTTWELRMHLIMLYAVIVSTFCSTAPLQVCCIITLLLMLYFVLRLKWVHAHIMLFENNACTTHEWWDEVMRKSYHRKTFPSIWYHNSRHV